MRHSCMAGTGPTVADDVADNDDRDVAQRVRPNREWCLYPWWQHAHIAWPYRLALDSHTRAVTVGGDMLRACDGK